MESTYAAAESRLRVSARQGRLRPPGAIARVAQAVIGLEAVLELVYLAVRRTGSALVGSLSGADTWVSLAAGLTFLMWYGCCRENAELIAPGRTPYRIGWGILAWFVPLFMWWGPWRVVLGLRRASGPGDTVLIGVWWAAWVADTIGYSVYLLLHPYGDLYPWWPMVLNAVAAGLCIAVISRVTSAQNASVRAAAA
jgi:hypothetical protein